MTEVTPSLAATLMTLSIIRKIDRQGPALRNDHTSITHLANIYIKLNVNNRVQALARAHDLKLWIIKRTALCASFGSILAIRVLTL